MLSPLIITFQRDGSQVLEKDIPGLQSQSRGFQIDLHLKGTEKGFAITPVL